MRHGKKKLVIEGDISYIQTNEAHGRIQCRLFFYYWGDYEFFFNLFSFFYKKEFFNEIFCNLLRKIHVVVPIDHMFCVKLLLNKYEILKVCKFCQILRFIMKIYHNFELYQNMLLLKHLSLEDLSETK
jgi:hypothetical protein